VDESCRLKRQFVAEASVKKLLYYDDKNILVTVANSMMLTLHSVSDDGETVETMKVASVAFLLLLLFFCSFSLIFCPSLYAFSALTLLVGWHRGRKGIRPVEAKWWGCWHGYLSGARCRLAYGPADATATHCLLL